MEQIPDAPWIRDAELNGYPDPDPVHCPVCEEECSEIYLDRDGNAVGCDYCICSQDAWDWWQEQKEIAEEAEIERKISERRDSGPW